MFNAGKLFCRIVNILSFITNGKAYSGVVRQPYKLEVDMLAPPPHSRRAKIATRTAANYQGLQNILPPITVCWKEKTLKITIFRRASWATSESKSESS
jgi:hypothetical protein